MVMRVVPLPAVDGRPGRGIKVKTLDMRKKLEENAEKHKQEFVESWAGYKDKASSSIENLRASAREVFAKRREELAELEEEVMVALNDLEGRLQTHDPDSDSPFQPFVTVDTSLDQLDIPMTVMLRVPTDHSDEYRRSIAHLEWEQDEEVMVSEDEFNRFILDEWDWRGDFAASHRAYTG